MFSTSTALERAVTYLKAQHAGSYPGLAHYMQPPAYLKYLRHPFLRILLIPWRGLIKGDVFQIAVIAELLSDLRDRLGADLQPEIDEILAYIDSRREEDGWRYFPGMSELHPDIDTRAQVTQANARSNRFIAVDPRIQQKGSGYIDTWIGASDADVLMFNEDRQGGDLAVMANYLYGLSHLPHDPARAEMIRRGIEFLETEAPRTDLRIGWYPNVLYTLYQLHRLFRLHGKEYRPAIDAARSYLLAPNDPLSTALAMLILGDDTAANAGRRYLESMQRPDGSWIDSVFIRTRFKRYSHRVIVTAYVASALSLPS